VLPLCQVNVAVADCVPGVLPWCWVNVAESVPNVLPASRINVSGCARMCCHGAGLMS
jgi:hypothetical protein